MKRLLIILLLFAVPCSAGIIMRGSGGSSTSNILSKVLGSEDNGDSLSVGSGTLTSSGVTHTTNHSGTADGAFTSIATSDVLFIQSTDNISGGIGSASMWYKASSPSAYAHYWAYDKDNDGTDDSYFKCLRFNSTTKTTCQFDSVDYDFTTSNFEDGSWHHLAWTWNHTTNEIKMFVDDTQQGSTQTITGSAPVVGSSKILIGMSADKSNTIRISGVLDTIIFTNDENYE